MAIRDSQKRARVLADLLSNPVISNGTDRKLPRNCWTCCSWRSARGNTCRRFPWSSCCGSPKGDSCKYILRRFRDQDPDWRAAESEIIVVREDAFVPRTPGTGQLLIQNW
jgi:hypothetical protein